MTEPITNTTTKESTGQIEVDQNATPTDQAGTSKEITLIHTGSGKSDTNTTQQGHSKAALDDTNPPDSRHQLRRFEKDQDASHSQQRVNDTNIQPKIEIVNTVELGLQNHHPKNNVNYISSP